MQAAGSCYGISRYLRLRFPGVATLREDMVIGTGVSLGLLLSASQPLFPDSDSRHAFVYVYVRLTPRGFASQSHTPFYS